MPNPGIGDPYWFEWYVGLKYIIEMLNPDSGISCVIFQHETYQTIDDVVVEYDNGMSQLCYQVKHEIATSQPDNLTFGKLLEKGENGKCLFEALFLGWKKASSGERTTIKPVLYTNRKILDRRAGRTYNGIKYSAYPVDQFLSLMQGIFENVKDYKRIVLLSGDPGSGKTSVISYLQSTSNFFLLRYHTFRPISPEQRFYDADAGICSSENLWGTLLIQLRQKLKGKLAEYEVPISNKLLTVEAAFGNPSRL